MPPELVRFDLVAALPDSRVSGPRLLPPRMPMAGPVSWQRVAGGVWAAILLTLAVRTLLAPRANTVYPIFAEAARHWQAGTDLYRPVSDPYRYSPLVAALLVPFSLLPDRVGGLLWRLLNAAVYLGALAWCSRTVPPRRWSPAQFGLVFLLTVPLAVGSLNNGQSNGLVTGLLLLTAAGAATGGWNLAGGCTALACLFKVYPIAVGLLLAAVHPRRFAGRLAVALLAGLLLPFLAQQPGYVLRQYAGWVQHLRTDDRQHLPPELCYRDLRLLCATCHLPLGSPAYPAVQLLAAAGMAGVCVMGRRRGWPERRLLTALLGLGSCWMTVFGSATESCTYILLAPALAWALLAAWSEPPGWCARLVLLASYGLLLVSGVVVWFPGGRSLHALGLQPLAGLLLLVGLLVRELTPPVAPSAPEPGVSQPGSSGPVHGGERRASPGPEPLIGERV